jgi:hypothetical protein
MAERFPLKKYTEFQPRDSDVFTIYQQFKPTSVRAKVRTARVKPDYSLKGVESFGPSSTLMNTGRGYTPKFKPYYFVHYQCKAPVVGEVKFKK